MWVSTERSYRLIQTPFKSAKKLSHFSRFSSVGGNPENLGQSAQTHLSLLDVKLSWKISSIDAKNNVDSTDSNTVKNG